VVPSTFSASPGRTTGRTNLPDSCRLMRMERQPRHSIGRSAQSCAAILLLGLCFVFLTPHPALAPPVANSPAYITFCINVHDFIHVEESADTILRLIDLFEAHAVQGDFYFTAPMIHAYEEERPEVLDRLRESGMTISYHIRPPHPAYRGFDDRLEGLDTAELDQLFRDYESYRLDLETGDLIYGEPGGIAYLTEVFGQAPSACSIPFERWRPQMLPIWSEMGGQVTVTYHESGTDPIDPFVWRDGLLIRPSDFSITRWAVRQGQEPQFWWNMLDTPLARDYIPIDRLRLELDAWPHERAPFITVLIHENNFYRQGATPWASIYYDDKGKSLPLSPPFDLDATDPSNARTDENRDAIWDGYAQLVAFAADRLRVVTSRDVAELARSEATPTP